MSAIRNFESKYAESNTSNQSIIDSKSLYDAVYSSNNPTEKRLKVELCAIRESLEKGEIQSVNWVVSQDQLDDCLTKQGASREKLYDVLNGKTKLY